MATDKIQEGDKSGLSAWLGDWVADWSGAPGAAPKQEATNLPARADAYTSASDSLSLPELLEKNGVARPGQKVFFQEKPRVPAAQDSEDPSELLQRDHLVGLAKTYEKQADQCDDFEQKLKLLCLAEQNYQLAGDIKSVCRVLEAQIFAAQEEDYDHLALELEAKLSALEGDYDLALDFQDDLKGKVLKARGNNKKSEIVKKVAQSKAKLHQAHALQLAEAGETGEGFEQMKAAVAEAPSPENGQAALVYYKLSGLGDLGALQAEIRNFEIQTGSENPEVAEAARAYLHVLRQREKEIRRELEGIVDLVWDEADYPAEAEKPHSAALKEKGFDREMYRAGAYVMLDSPATANKIYSALWNDVRASGQEQMPVVQWQAEVAATSGSLAYVEELAEAQRADLYRLDPNLSVEAFSGRELPDHEDGWIVFFENEADQVRALLRNGFLEETQRMIAEARTALEASSLHEDLKEAYRGKLRAQLNFVEDKIDEMMEEAFGLSSKDGLRLKTGEERRRYARALAEGGLIGAARKSLVSMQTDYQDPDYRQTNLSYFRQLSALGKARAALALGYPGDKLLENVAIDTLAKTQQELLRRPDLADELAENRWMLAQLFSESANATNAVLEDERWLRDVGELSPEDPQYGAYLMVHLRLAKNLFRIGKKDEEILEHIDLVLKASDGNPYLVSEAVDLLAELEFRKGNSDSWYAFKARIAADYPQSPAAARIDQDPRLFKMRDAEGRLDPAREINVRDYDEAAKVAFVESGNIHPAEHLAWMFAGLKVGSRFGPYGAVAGVLGGLALGAVSGSIQNSDKIANAHRYGTSNVDSRDVANRMLGGASELVVGVSGGMLAPVVGNGVRNTVGFYSEELLTLMRSRVSAGTFKALTQVNQGALHVAGGLASVAAMTTWSGAMQWGMTGEHHLLSREHVHETLLLYKLIEIFALAKSRGYGARYAVAPRFQTGATEAVYLGGREIGRSNVSGRLGGWALDVAIAGHADFYLTTLNNAIVGQPTPENFAALLRAQAAAVNGHYWTLAPMHHGTQVTMRNWSAYRTHVGLGELEHRARLARLDDMIKNPPRDFGGGPPMAGPPWAYAGSYPFDPLAMQAEYPPSTLPELWMTSLGNSGGGEDRDLPDLSGLSEEARAIAEEPEFLSGAFDVIAIPADRLAEAESRLSSAERGAILDIADAEGRIIGLIDVRREIYSPEGKLARVVATAAEAAALERYRREMNARAALGYDPARGSGEVEAGSKSSTSAESSFRDSSVVSVVNGFDFVKVLPRKSLVVEQLLIKHHGKTVIVMIIAGDRVQLAQLQNQFISLVFSRDKIHLAVQDVLRFAKLRNYQAGLAAIYSNESNASTVTYGQNFPGSWMISSRANMIHEPKGIRHKERGEDLLSTRSFPEDSAIFWVNQEISFGRRGYNFQGLGIDATWDIGQISSALRSKISNEGGYPNLALAGAHLKEASLLNAAYPQAIDPREHVRKKYRLLDKALERAGVSGSDLEERRLAFLRLEPEARIEIILLMIDIIDSLGRSSNLELGELHEKIGYSKGGSPIPHWKHVYDNAMRENLDPVDGLIAHERQAKAKENNNPSLKPDSSDPTPVNPAREMTQLISRGRQANDNFESLLIKNGISDGVSSPSVFNELPIEERLDIILAAIELIRYSDLAVSRDYGWTHAQIAERIGFRTIRVLASWITICKDAYTEISKSQLSDSNRVEAAFRAALENYEKTRVRNRVKVVSSKDGPFLAVSDPIAPQSEQPPTPEPVAESQVPPPPPVSEVEARVAWAKAARKLFITQYGYAVDGHREQFSTPDFLRLVDYAIHWEDPAQAGTLTLQQLKSLIKKSPSPEFEAINRLYIVGDIKDLKLMIEFAEKKQGNGNGSH